MLICPQCQFANPNTNKFCQGCGTALTYKICPECDTNVALNEQHCPNCGANTGTVWWAIITGTRGLGLEARDWGAQGAQEAEEDGRLPIRLEKFGGTQTDTATPVASTEGTEAQHELNFSQNLKSKIQNSSSPQPPASSHYFLDPQQRYELLEPLEKFGSENVVLKEVQVRVLDTQPFQLSLLAAGADLIMEQAIPAIAKTYIALSSSLGQHLPTIHDAWQQGNQQVLLIADRSSTLR